MIGEVGEKGMVSPERSWVGVYLDGRVGAKKRGHTEIADRAAAEVAEETDRGEED